MFCSYLASVLLFVAVVYGQNCNQETDKYRQCLQQKQQEQHDAMAKEREAGAAKMKDTIKQCFSSSGCKEPNFEQSSSQGKGDGKGGWGKGKGKEGGADFEKRRECSKQVEDKARATVEKCVQAKQPDFKFPTPDNKNQQKGSSKGGMGGGSHFGNFGKTINDSCPTDDNRQKAKTCMRDAFQKGGSSNDKRQQGEARFNQTCASRDACFNAMPAQCQTQFNETKKTICDCAKQMLTSSKTQLDQDYNTCAGTTAVTTLSPQDSGRGHRFGGFGQQHGSNVESMVRRLCSDRDVCHGGFSKGGGHGMHGHFGNGGRGGHGHGQH